LRDIYTAKPNTVLYGYKRQGGAVANSEAIKVLKVAVS
jgi:HK97 family phage major capsid protein